jgi:hypothetical protein
MAATAIRSTKVVCARVAVIAGRVSGGAQATYTTVSTGAGVAVLTGLVERRIDAARGCITTVVGTFLIIIAVQRLAFTVSSQALITGRALIVVATEEGVGVKLAPALRGTAIIGAGVLVGALLGVSGCTDSGETVVGHSAVITIITGRGVRCGPVQTGAVFFVTADQHGARVTIVFTGDQFPGTGSVLTR